MSNKKSFIQMKLDFGQKQFGMQKCKTCGMIYTAGDEDDIKSHEKYHKNTLKIGKYKKENIMEDFFNGDEIILLDLKSHSGINTFNSVVHKINEELGDVNEGNNDEKLKEKINANIKAFIYVKTHGENKRTREIVGCCVCESIKEASKIIPGRFGLASSVMTSALCGIQKIWVDKRFRKMGIATALIDSCRKNMIYCFTVPIDKIAFTAPTADGRIFAEKYCKTDSFLVY